MTKCTATYDNESCIYEENHSSLHGVHLTRDGFYEWDDLRPDRYGVVCSHCSLLIIRCTGLSGSWMHEESGREHCSTNKTIAHPGQPYPHRRTGYGIPVRSAFTWQSREATELAEKKMRAWEEQEAKEKKERTKIEQAEKRQKSFDDMFTTKVLSPMAQDSSTICAHCGLVVGDKKVHFEWHENQAKIAHQAHRADSWNSLIR